MALKTQEQNDIYLLKMDMEKVTRHLNKQEKTGEENSLMLLNIQTALLGTEFNEKKGMVYILNDIDKKVRAIEKRHSEYDIYISQGKWVIGIMGSAFVGFIIYTLKLIKGI